MPSHHQLEHALRQYLMRYAEPIAQGVTELPWGRQRYGVSAVLVAFDEERDCVDALLARERRDEPALLILVVNEPPKAGPEQRKRNRALLDSARARGKVLGASADRVFTWVEAAPGSSVDLLVVDACTSNLRLAEGQGVGRARKIGFDLALVLHRRGVVLSHYCGSLDADVVLPPDYWSALRARNEGPLPPYAALLFDYQHLPTGDERIDLAMQRLELHFRCYVLGLAHAGSPWAYHSLGSALALSLPHYALARGFPDRTAGEDFYVLQKLGRIAPLFRAEETMVSIRTRISDRVPFGTGPVLAARLQSAVGVDPELETYDPRVYFVLRDYLAVLDQWVLAAPTEQEPPLAERSRWLSTETRAEARSLVSGLEPSLAQCRSEAARRRRLHERFGAIQTLQFVRQLSKTAFSMVPVEEALRRLAFGEQTMSPLPERSWHKHPPSESLAKLAGRALVNEKGLPRELGACRSDPVQTLDIYVDPRAPVTFNLGRIPEP